MPEKEKKWFAWELTEDLSAREGEKMVARELTGDLSAREIKKINHTGTNHPLLVPASMKNNIQWANKPNLKIRTSYYKKYTNSIKKPCEKT
ncbi:hypothetical protein BIV60_18835 [Bacillus sp. MUM 116]|uniref:hypothetical protein n=1 Tax=Bacillus sp. MUM 116 TaxID=1678002 RepID=UPI0008F57421|nr:hypothetical protein [Bacillus sp. MUM 116]OIK11013.1 hypothetical protein BIV60_18835 [Bacillus sp. MUM 116]